MSHLGVRLSRQRLHAWHRLFSANSYRCVGSRYEVGLSSESWNGRLDNSHEPVCWNKLHVWGKGDIISVVAMRCDCNSMVVLVRRVASSLHRSGSAYLDPQSPSEASWPLQCLW